MGGARGFIYRRQVTVEVPELGDPPEVEIRFEGLSVLWVEVAGADGAPVRGTKVLCVGAEGEVKLARRSTGGRAREYCALVEPGCFRVTASAPDRAPGEHTVRLAPGEEKHIPVRLER